MVSPILATKLYLPPSRPKLVHRPRLTERLNEGLHRKLTLVSAPAGFGKTTLVSEWAAGCSRDDPGFRVAWLSLDEADSDPARFLTYLVAAIHRAAPELEEGMLGALQSARPPDLEPALNTLLNEIAGVAGRFILVLDDYHVVDARAVDEALAYLIEHLPPQVRLVILTREDPQLPLARLRARDQLTELRVSDLRFTPPEAAGFLQTMNLNLLAEDVAALDERTEGWIAGLQLAALAMGTLAEQGRLGEQALSGFVRAFAGDHRYIMDYLVEEVLQRQPAPVRRFLLQTSILDRLHGPLCDAVTGQADGGERLEALRKGNFFVISLDDQRQWYRYHHLFAEVLRVYLRAEQPDQAAVLHRRASAWFEQHGSPAEAIRHALAAEDFARAAVLVELAFPALARSRQEATLLGWLRALPEALVRGRPVLSNLYAGVLLQSGEPEGVDAWLRAAETGISCETGISGEMDMPDGVEIANEEQYRRLPGSIAIHRAGQALMVGDVAATMKHARRALELAPEDDHLVRGGAAALLGLAFWTDGDLAAAQRLYGEGMAGLQRAGNISDLMGCALALADIQIAQGRLHAALGTYERALQLAADRGTPALRGTADMYVGMSELYREWGDLQEAGRLLAKCQEQGEHTGLPQNRYRWRVAAARMREAEGDWQGALALLDEAERLYMSDFSPNVRPVAAIRARVWAAQGRLGEALDWARERGLSAGDELSYLREFEHITLARILLARYRDDRAGGSVHEAVGLLERLLQAAEAGRRAKSAVEIRLLLAQAYHAQGDRPAGLQALRQSLALAELEGYVRLFVDEGPPVTGLLREAAVRETLPPYPARLLAALQAAEQRGNAGAAPPLNVLPVQAAKNGQATQGGRPVEDPLVEPLSQRELDVLRLFETELTGPEIAEALMVALSTVRTHTKSIYSKLNVNNRRAAIRRAAELRLL